MGGELRGLCVAGSQRRRQATPLLCGEAHTNVAHFACGLLTSALRARSGPARSGHSEAALQPLLLRVLGVELRALLGAQAVLRLHCVLEHKTGEDRHRLGEEIHLATILISGATSTFTEAREEGAHVEREEMVALEDHEESLVLIDEGQRADGTGGELRVEKLATLQLRQGRVHSGIFLSAAALWYRSSPLGGSAAGSAAQRDAPPLGRGRCLGRGHELGEALLEAASLQLKYLLQASADEGIAQGLLAPEPLSVELAQSGELRCVRCLAQDRCPSACQLRQEGLTEGLVETVQQQRRPQLQHLLQHALGRLRD
mmetsp:Transcript_44702/g.95245  ORF Transcript_44702/g.95245 Transcript_44702/m.95245 type:complete len:314 (-) Transcript_44702:715-1656(-)